MRNLERALITVKPKDNAINGDPQELQDHQWLLHCKLTLFGFLVVLYDRVDDGDKFSKKNFGLGSLPYHATSHLKVVQWFVQVYPVFERLFKCYFAVLISLTKNFRKKHTHTRLFFFEKWWVKFFLKLFVFAIQF